MNCEQILSADFVDFGFLGDEIQNPPEGGLGGRLFFSFITVLRKASSLRYSLFGKIISENFKKITVFQARKNNGHRSGRYVSVALNALLPIVPTIGKTEKPT